MEQAYENELDNAIQLARSILDEIEQTIVDLNKRVHPTPSRKRRRASVNFIQNIFDNEDMPRDFMTLFRMSKRLFDKLLSYIEDDLKDEATRSIPTRDKLALYLLFVGSGWTTHHISASTKYGEKTVRTHILRVSTVIQEKMTRFLKTPTTEDEWRRIAAGFEERTYLANCIGALDGKYIYLRKPDHSGSEWYSHKMRHATTLMALVDSEFKFIWCDVGSFGSNHDSFVFNSSELCEYLEENKLNVPPPSCLPKSEKIFPYYIVADDAFGLRSWLMKPLKRMDRELSLQENEANYRISLARRVVEQAFGILTKKMCILQRSIQLSHPNLMNVTKSMLIVHNFLREESTTEEEEFFNCIHRSENVKLLQARLVDNVPYYMNQRPEHLRNVLFEYLTHEGKIPFQEGRTGNIS